MALENLEAALNSMTDEQLIPTPPEPPPDNTWEPGTAAIKIIVGLMKDGVEAGWLRPAIFKDIITRAHTQYDKTVTRRQLQEIWDAWQAEIVERQTPEVPEP